MRSALAVLLALTVVFFGLLGWSNAQLHQDAYDVTTTSTTLAGDPSQAAGIQVTSYFDDRGHLFWSSSYPADAPQEAQTRYGFSQTQWEEDWEYEFGSFEISLQSVGRYSSSSLEDLVTPSFLSLLKEVQDDYPQVTTDQQTIPLSHYTDHIPLYVSQYLPGSSLFLEVTDRQLTELLEDYFFFPVPEGLTATISLETDEEGVLQGYNFFLDDDDCYLSSQYAVRGDTVLFALIPGEGLDPSHIPGGWGVYALSGNTPEDLSLTTVYSVPNGGQVVQFFEGQEGDDDLYLLTVEQDVLYLTQLDSQSLQPVLHLPLFPWAEERDLDGTVWTEAGLAVFSNDGPFVMLVPDGANSWRIDFEGDVKRQNDLGCFLNMDGTTSLLYDGERLAVTGSYWQEGLSRNVLFLAVYDRDGLAYLGTYPTSLPGQVGNLYQLSPSHVLSWAETDS